MVKIIVTCECGNRMEGELDLPDYPHPEVFAYTKDCRKCIQKREGS